MTMPGSAWPQQTVPGQAPAFQPQPVMQPVAQPQGYQYPVQGANVRFSPEQLPPPPQQQPQQQFMQPAQQQPGQQPQQPQQQQPQWPGPQGPAPQPGPQQFQQPTPQPWQPPTPMAPAGAVLNAPGLPPELQGMPVAQFAQAWGTLRNYFAQRGQTPVQAAQQGFQQPGLPQYPGQQQYPQQPPGPQQQWVQPQQPQPQRKGFWADPEAFLDNKLDEKLGQVLNRVQAPQNAETALQLAAQQEPAIMQFMPHITQLIQQRGLSAEHLSTPESWNLLYFVARGQAEQAARRNLGVMTPQYPQQPVLRPNGGYGMPVPQMQPMAPPMQFQQPAAMMPSVPAYGFFTEQPGQHSQFLQGLQPGLAGGIEAWLTAEDKNAIQKMHNGNVNEWLAFGGQHVIQQRMQGGFGR